MLVTTEWLEKNLTNPNLRLVDCRTILGKPSAGTRAGKEAYLAGHIPGAIHLDIDSDLAGHGGPGRHPIPKPASFSTMMSNAGIDQNIQVVAYDDTGGALATRLWRLLRYYGHEKVSLLDGGWTKWVAEKRLISKEIPKIKARSFKATPHPEWVV